MDSPRDITSAAPRPTSALRRWLRRILWLTLFFVVCISALLAWNLRAPEVAEPHVFPNITPPKDSAALKLRVATWNVWGLRVITPRREERLKEIARQAAALRPDIVGFQEAFVASDRAVLLQALKHEGLQHARYFHSGLVGSGLLLVSRFPIESDGFVRYSSNGYPWALHHADWWAGKGLSLSTIKVREDVRLFVANTHMHARYGGIYHQTQSAQAGQLLPWARKVTATGLPALWLGDWNNTAQSDVLAPLIEAGGWRALDGDSPGIDQIFGSGSGWEWQVTDRGTIKGFLPGEPKVPWSDHAARWVDVALRYTGASEN